MEFERFNNPELGDHNLYQHYLHYIWFGGEIFYNRLKRSLKGQ